MEVTVSWMAPDGHKQGGASFGVPWKKGTLARDAALYVYDDGGDEVPSQRENRAFWPDGSVKWTLHSIVANAPSAAYTVSDRAPAHTNASAELRVEELSDGLRVDNGADAWILRKGTDEAISICRDGRRISGRLTLLSEQQFATGNDDTLTRVTAYVGIVKRVEIERAGRQCVVICLRGSHRQRGTVHGREWLPFELRLYFYSGRADVRVVHTFIFDGNEEEDFIRGIGLELTLPLSGALHNRFVRFGGEI